MVNKMFLCLDIGNTNMVIGVFNEDGTSVSDFRLSTKRNLTTDEQAMGLIELLHFKGIKEEDISGVIISSVVPEIDGELKDLFKKYFGVDALFVGPGIKSGVNIKIDNPKQLGADLLVGAVGAIEKYKEPVLVIDCGTAMTITFVNKQKEFIGGAIMPGIRTAFSNLIDKASKLEEVSFEDVEGPIGSSTKDCIQSGMIFGWSSMIDGMIDKYHKILGDFKVVLTGGDARYLVKHLEHEVVYDDNLLLDGLKILYFKNKK